MSTPHCLIHHWNITSPEDVPRGQELPATCLRCPAERTYPRIMNGDNLPLANAVARGKLKNKHWQGFYIEATEENI